MVCLGNICRSPMAEGIMRARAEEMNMELELDSAGTSGHHSGESPDRRAISCMKEKGIDISKLRARRFSVEDFNRFDIIFTMDHSNHRDVLALARTEDDRSKVHLFLAEFGNKAVPDPWYGEMTGFYEVFDLLNEACTHHIQKWRKTQ
jgi:protein-tyrosine phosphatase